MLKLSTKCWISAFNAQSSRGIIVAGQVGAVKISVAAVEPLRKKEMHGETQEPSEKSEAMKRWYVSLGPQELMSVFQSMVLVFWSLNPHFATHIFKKRA